MHKREQFAKASQQLAAITKVLGYPARVAIVRLLAQRRACVCGGDGAGTAAVATHRFAAPEGDESCRPAWCRTKSTAPECATASMPEAGNWPSSA